MIRLTIPLVLLCVPAGCTNVTEGDEDISIGTDSFPWTYDLGKLDATVITDTSPDSVTPGPDGASPNPGETGEPCESNVDCDSGYCIEGPDGYICTELCDEKCPEGYTCKGINSGGGDVVFLCVPPPPLKASLCEPCEVHSTCLGERAGCLAIDGGFTVFGF